MAVGPLTGIEVFDDDVIATHTGQLSVILCTYYGA